MLKAYFDDSNMGQGPFAVLAGWVARPGMWGQFSKDWDDVLRMSPRIRYFKWDHARGLNGEFYGIQPKSRDEKLNLLIGVLTDHNPLGVASVISNKLHRQIFGENPDRIVRGPYFLSFYSVVTQLVDYLKDHDPGAKVDFVFDIQPDQMEAAFASWERLKEVAPAYAKSMIGNVMFHDDIQTMPLQAADLSAGWLRELADSVFGRQVELEPPWGGRAERIRCLTRLWTADVYEEFSRKSRAFQMPKELRG